MTGIAPAKSPRTRLAAAVCLCLAAWPLAAQQQLLSTERMYHESLQAYKQGRYQMALEGFMDVLLEDPAYPDAQEQLAMAGRAILEQERLRMDQERREILSDIMRLHEPFMERKAAEERAWDKNLQKVLALARDPATLHAALFAYEQALETFPVYADQQETFQRARTDFYAAYQDAQWRSRESRPAAKKGYVPGNLDGVEARQFASSPGSLLLLEEEEGKAAGRITALEDDLKRQLAASRAALDRYQSRSYQDSARLWGQILAQRPRSMEARYYVEQTRARLLEPPAAAPAPAAAKAGWQAPPPQAPPAPLPAASVSARQEKPPAQPPPAAQPAAEAATEDNLAAEKLTVPQVAQDYYLKGLRAYSLGDLDTAIQNWRTCLEIDSEHPKARKALARALREKK